MVHMEFKFDLEWERAATGSAVGWLQKPPFPWGGDGKLPFSPTDEKLRAGSGPCKTVPTPAKCSLTVTDSLALIYISLVYG